MGSDKKLYGTLTAIGLAVTVGAFSVNQYYMSKADQLVRSNQNFRALVEAKKEISQQRGENIDVYEVKNLQRIIDEQMRTPKVSENLAQYGNYYAYGTLSLIIGFLSCSAAVLVTGPQLLQAYNSQRRKEEQQKL